MGSYDLCRDPSYHRSSSIRTRNVMNLGNHQMVKQNEASERHLGDLCRKFGGKPPVPKINLSQMGALE